MNLNMKQTINASTLGRILFAFALLLLSSCTSMVVNPMIDPLTLALQRQTDLDLLQDGTPSLLLILEGLITKDPDNQQLLMAATKAYGGYATILHGEGQTERAVTISSKAKEHGIRLLEKLSGLKGVGDMPLTDLVQALGEISRPGAGKLFWGAYGWAVWIQYQNGAPAAVAKLPIVEQIMLRVVELDESYYYGGAHIFLGAYYGSRPKILGGKPEESRQHFERALALNDRKFLLTQVAYAETYARTAFNQELFSALLKEVIEAPLVDSEISSSNKLAKVKAEKLFAEIDNYF
jgi:hypothetical protein